MFSPITTFHSHTLRFIASFTSNMAIAVLKEVDKLKGLAKHARRRAVANLVDQKQLDIDGLTLYKYHIIGYLHRTEPWVLEAELIAGLRWNKITTDEENQEQHQFWIRQTAELVKGSASPLNSETLDDFLANRLYSHSTESDGEEEVKKCFLLTTSADSGKEDDWMDILAPQVATQLEPADNQHHELATAHHDILEPPVCEHDAISTRIAKLKSMPRGPDKKNEFRRLRDAFSSDGRTLFEYHATASTDEELDRAHGENMQEANMAKAWERLPPGEKGFWQHNTVKMASALSRCLLNGLDHLAIGTGSKKSIEYGSRTRRATREGGMREDPTCSKIAAPDAAALRDTSIGSNDAGMELQDLEHTTKTPILDFLHGSSTVDSLPETVVNRVLASLTNLINKDPSVKLRVRRAGMRVNYDPKAADVTGIANRLRTAVYRSLTVKRVTRPSISVPSHFEWLLRPLVYYNEGNGAFASLKDLNFLRGETSAFSTHYRSCTEWVERTLKGLAPLTPAKQEEITAAAMDGVQERVKARVRMHCRGCHREIRTDHSQIPDRRLLLPIKDAVQSGVGGGSERDNLLIRRMENWGLADNESGFALHLRSCFEWKDLTSEEYEDMLEQKVYALHCSDNSLLFRNMAKRPVPRQIAQRV